jgi:hypothetical protein
VRQLDFLINRLSNFSVQLVDFLFCKQVKQFFVGRADWVPFLANRLRSLFTGGRQKFPIADSCAFFIEVVKPSFAGRTGDFVLFLENDAKYLIFAAFPKSSVALFVS